MSTAVAPISSAQALIPSTPLEFASGHRVRRAQSAGNDATDIASSGDSEVHCFSLNLRRLFLFIRDFRFARSPRLAESAATSSDTFSIETKESMKASPGEAMFAQGIKERVY
jgi:hypothetical protein